MKYSFFILLLLGFKAPAQDPTRFSSEVDAIQKKYDTLWDASKETIVFTGSSSIRKWKTVQDRFPSHQVVNSGFGGSEASDLLYYCYDLIVRYQPKEVFIYEGDNDLFDKKKPNHILDDFKKIIEIIKNNDPQTKIVLISAKPSISRWHLRRKYKRLNRKMEKLTKSDSLLSYADVWDVMLHKRKLKRDIFTEDGLHMNQKGYDLWYTIIKPYIN